MDYQQFIADINNIFLQFRQDILAILPSLISALLVLIAGLLLAHIVKRIVIRYVSILPDILPHQGVRAKLKKIRLKRAAVVLANVLFWIIIILFLTIITEILGLPVLSTWLSGIAKYLPNILVAMLIIFIGVISSMVVRDLIASTAKTTGITYGELLGKGIQLAIIVVTVLIAIEQIGIDTQIISGLIYITLGASLFGFALAFGLGARSSVGNILAAYYLQNHYRKGQRIKIGSHEGEIIEISPTYIILKTTNGEACIPAKLFSELVSERLPITGNTPAGKQ